MSNGTNKTEKEIEEKLKELGFAPVHNIDSVFMLKIGDKSRIIVNTQSKTGVFIDEKGNKKNITDVVSDIPEVYDVLNILSEPPESTPDIEGIPDHEKPPTHASESVSDAQEISESERVCTACGRIVDERVYEYSMDKYGKVLCYACQHKSAASRSPPAFKRTEPLMIKTLTPRLAEVGKIKIGRRSEKKTASGTALPEKLDHFEIYSLLRDENGYLIPDEEMNAKIGENCRELDIYLPYDDPRLNFPTWYAYYTASGAHCFGDGETAKTADGEMIECNPETCEYYQSGKCRMHGRLSVILAQSNSVGGVYVFRTTSIHSIQNIMSSMAFISSLTGGILAGIPLKMRLIPKTVTPDGVGAPVKIWTVNIEFPGGMQNLTKALSVEAERRRLMRKSMEEIEAEVKAIEADVVMEEEGEAGE